VTAFKNDYAAIITNDVCLSTGLSRYSSQPACGNHNGFHQQYIHCQLWEQSSILQAVCSAVAWRLESWEHG